MRAIQLLRKLDPDAWGGTETALQRLLVGMQERGITPVVYCPRLARHSAPDPLRETGCQVRRFRAFVPIWGISRERRRQLISVSGNLMSFDLLWSLGRERKAAVIHAHTLGRIGGIARTVARMHRIPLVVSIHGGALDLPPTLVANGHDTEPGVEWGKIFGWLLRSRALFRDADAIVTCNGKEADLLQARFPHKRIVVQPHGVPVPDYQRDHRAEARAAYPQLRDRDILLCVGRVDPVKNQMWLLEQAPAIFEHHPRATLVLAGACTDEPYGRQIDETIRRLGIQDRVLLTGAFTQDDPRVIGLMQEARAVILPSHSETFGLVILEAWAAGAPVLSSQTSGARALVRNGHNGWLFDLRNPGTFHEVLDRVFAEPALAREMAARGTETSQGYSVAAAADRIKRLYEQVIEEKQCAA